MPPDVLVGCCGFSVSRKRYFESLNSVEIQRTFYKLPRESTAEKWRREAPPGFTYTLKAWAALTHSPGSLIWRKSGISCEGCGDLRPTEANFRAWSMVLKIARALEATFVVFQSPPSFSKTDERVRDLGDFFSSIERDGMRLGWEPRHESWWAEREFLTSLMDELDLTHIVDPTVGEPLDSGPVAYFRLHGRWEGRRIVYNHQYSEDELSKVLEAVRRELERRERVYVMFNNGRFMFEDALRFLSMLSSQSK